MGVQPVCLIGRTQCIFPKFSVQNLSVEVEFPEKFQENHLVVIKAWPPKVHIQSLMPFFHFASLSALPCTKQSVCNFTELCRSGIRNLFVVKVWGGIGGWQCWESRIPTGAELNGGFLFFFLACGDQLAQLCCV